MAFETDDLEPRQKKSQPRNLDPMSIEDLLEYVAVLKAEVVRVEEKCEPSRATPRRPRPFSRSE